MIKNIQQITCEKTFPRKEVVQLIQNSQKRNMVRQLKNEGSTTVLVPTPFQNT